TKPCPDSDDIFERAPQFDSCDVVGSIDAVMGGGEDDADTDGNLFVVGCDNGSRWFKFGHFAGEVGATKGSDTQMCVRDLLADDFGHAFEGTDFNALAGTDE